MIKFEKISLEQFIKDVKGLYPGLSESEILEIKEAYNKLELPKRGSKGSAGYDFHSPFNFIVVAGGESVVIPTGIRAVMPLDTYLQIVPRSSVGFKTGVRFSNSVAIIDADYSESPNEGHIMLKFVPGFKTFTAEAGDRIAQGIFLKYYTTDDDNTTKVRKGGLGSTGK